ncbi:hypothetical protein ACIODS_11800 [Micromonospora chalcea]|uniref:hypothetical protein n=1 Tax=Micromonospora chalcea TaxID=1874 RepID=UPI00380B6723
MTWDETLHAQLRRIADDPIWQPVIRAEAKRAATTMPDGPAVSDREVHAMLRRAIVDRPAGRPDSIEGLRARLRQDVCCDLHNQHCEPPSDLCCPHCTEASHPEHRNGERCVLNSSPATDRRENAMNHTTTVPNCPTHGPMARRPDEQTSQLQARTGVWFDCTDAGCDSTAVLPSPELLADSRTAAGPS